MLWYKGWYETRWRFAMSTGMMLLLYANPLLPMPKDQMNFLAALPFYAMIVAVTLAGPGIRTQSSFQPRTEHFASAYFTLSMPVSRVRLVLTRAAVGFSALAVMIAVAVFSAWSRFPDLHDRLTATEALLSSLALLVCASSTYTMSTLYGLFLNAVGQIYSTLITCGLLAWLCNRFEWMPLRPIALALGSPTPLIHQPGVWTVLLTCAGLSTVFLAVTCYAAEKKEY